MNLRQFFFSLLIFIGFFSIAYCNSILGVVNLSTCIKLSKYGKQEQEALESVQTQMTTLMGDLEKQINVIANQLNDPEFVDSLSPEAEQEMQARFHSLGEELNRYRAQYYQVMNQTHIKLMQTMSHYVARASTAIAQKEKIDMVLNQDACFYFPPESDITTSVIKEMDRQFEQENHTSNHDVNSPAASVQTKPE